MRRLGFRPTPNSGAGEIHKEDGENDIAICQLKSTDLQSISIKQNDLHVLVAHAETAHKTPVFVIQFLNTGEVWYLTRPEDVELLQNKTKNIFEDCEKTVDKEQEFCYNNSEQLKEAKARVEYNKRMSELRGQREREIKERRKGRWRKNSNSQG